MLVRPYVVRGIVPAADCRTESFHIQVV